MIIVAGTITLDPSDIEQIRSAAADMIAATRTEPACRYYDFSVSITDPSVVQIFEIWDSVEGPKSHFATEHMATCQDALGGVVVLGRDLHPYEVAGVRPVR